MKSLIALFFVVMTSQLFAQSKSDQGYVLAEEQSNQKTNLDGTYQFQVSKGGKSVRLNEELIEIIVQNRKENADVTYKVSDDVTLYIPSRSRINAADFEALKPVVRIK